MLYFLSFLSDGGDVFNLFRYITFRAGGAFFTALTIFFTFGKYSINFLKKLQKEGQPIREDGPKEHIIKKAGTPTMGGVIILLAVTVSTVLWARLDNHYVWIILFVTFSFGFIGLIKKMFEVRQQKLLARKKIKLMTKKWPWVVNENNFSKKITDIRNCLLYTSPSPRD